MLTLHMVMRNLQRYTAINSQGYRSLRQSMTRITFSTSRFISSQSIEELRQASQKKKKKENIDIPSIDNQNQKSVLH